MISRDQIQSQLDNCLLEARFNQWETLYKKGKVRDMYLLPDRRVLITTDRQSAFDHVLGAIPLKGQVLNRIAQYWFEQTADGWVRHDVISPGNERFIHEGLPVDVDQDGDLDLVSVLESMRTPFGTDYAAEVIWFEALEPGRFATEPHRIGDGLGSLVEPHDVDGDGDVDLISGEYFAGLGASYTWMEQVEAPSSDQPAGVWVRHLIDDQSGPSIQFTLIEDLFGDGVTRGVGSNHTNTTSNPDDPASEVAVYTPTADPRAPWTKQVISDDIISRPGTGVAAPGIFGYGDADNDGDIDLVVSGDGDPRIFLFEQTAPGEFVQHTLETNLGQAGGTLIEDLDGDGDNELLVTGYEDNVLFIYSQP